MFTFLVHNGAGKTTTIYMLTGMLDITEGDCMVYNYSVKKHSSIVQKNLGLCQQFDVLFDTLTVYQHLWLVCEIKNMPAELIETAIAESMQEVMLTEFKDKIS